MAWGSSRSRLLRDWGLLQFKRRRQEGRLVRQALRRVKFLADFPELAKDGAKAAQQVAGVGGVRVMDGALEKHYISV